MNAVEWRDNDLSVRYIAGLREAVWLGERGVYLVALAAVSLELVACQWGKRSAGIRCTHSHLPGSYVRSPLTPSPVRLHR